MILAVVVGFAVFSIIGLVTSNQSNHTQLVGQAVAQAKIRLASSAVITITKTISKDTVIPGDIADITFNIINQGDAEVFGKLVDSPGDFVNIIDKDIPLVAKDGGFQSSMDNIKTFEIIIPAHSSIVKSYKIEFPKDTMPQILNKDLFLGQSIFTDINNNKFLSNSVKVFLSSGLALGLVGPVCNYNYECDSGETPENCFQDCAPLIKSSIKSPSASITGKLTAGTPDTGSITKMPISRSAAGLQSGPVAAPINRPQVPISTAPPPAFPNCGNNICDDRENPYVCPQDCPIKFPDEHSSHTVCGWGEIRIQIGWGLGLDFTYEKSLGLKYYNMNIATPEMKKAIKEFVYRDSKLYNEVKNGLYDHAVQKVANAVRDMYLRDGGHYRATPCDVEGGHDPTSANELLLGGYGNCVDWSNLQVSLLSTLGVPKERVLMVCFNSKNYYSAQHCVAQYYSDSGIPWVLEYGMIAKSMQDLGRNSCLNEDYSQWANDGDYGWGMHGTSCYETPNCVSRWQDCTEWSACSSAGEQERTCKDANNCPRAEPLVEKKPCIPSTTAQTPEYTTCINDCTAQQEQRDVQVNECHSRCNWYSGNDRTSCRNGCNELARTSEATRQQCHIGCESKKTPTPVLTPIPPQTQTETPTPTPTQPIPIPTPVPTQPQTSSCTDSDDRDIFKIDTNAPDKFIRGIVRANDVNNNFGTFEDYCLSNTFTPCGAGEVCKYLQEFYCNTAVDYHGMITYESLITCSNGCKDGACLRVPLTITAVPQSTLIASPIVKKPSTVNAVSPTVKKLNVISKLKK